MKIKKNYNSIKKEPHRNYYIKIMKIIKLSPLLSLAKGDNLLVKLSPFKAPVSFKYKYSNIYISTRKKVYFKYKYSYFNKKTSLSCKIKTPLLHCFLMVICLMPITIFKFKGCLGL